MRTILLSALTDSVHGSNCYTAQRRYTTVPEIGVPAFQEHDECDGRHAANERYGRSQHDNFELWTQLAI
jgi:hypothetical protein